MTATDDFDIGGSLVGKDANKLDDLHKLYRRHAAKVGFTFKMATSRLNAEGLVYEKYFMCSRAGKPDPVPKTPVITPSPTAGEEEGGRNQRKKRVDCIIKTGCKAKLVISCDTVNNYYKVTRHVEGHNHALTRPEWSYLHRVERTITAEKAETIELMERAGLRPTVACKYMAASAGGQENVGHIERDHINHVSRIRTKEMGGADAQNVLDILKKRQTQDPQFYYTAKLDEDGKLCSLYWRDSMMKDDYLLYGDVVVFDTTYRTNKYGLICAPFVGVNNHWNNVMFGCAFIANESTESFVWLLTEFVESMGGKKPATIFTDQDFAISKGIELVRFCQLP